VMRAAGSTDQGQDPTAHQVGDGHHDLLSRIGVAEARPRDDAVIAALGAPPGGTASC
jgi:hypothetical protein